MHTEEEPKVASLVVERKSLFPVCSSPAPATRTAIREVFAPGVGADLAP